MQIVALSIIQNNRPTIAAMLRSIAWVNRIVLVIDHSTDGTIDVVRPFFRADQFPPIEIIESPFPFSMMTHKDGRRDNSNELEYRNAVLRQVFEKYSQAAILLIDGDELLTGALRTIITNAFQNEQTSSIALTCNHLFDRERYLHFNASVWNGVPLIDPHIRVLRTFQAYETGDWEDTPDCFLRHSKRTLCIDGPFHFHLRYLNVLKMPNYSIHGISTQPADEDYLGLLRKLPFPLPQDIAPILDTFW